jgi:pyruvate/2-oxoglutarate dehydrogenase complex dihydrolipoamide dehydrogenase (E3) component
MVASGRVAYLARRAADYGVHIGPVSVDIQKVRQRKRDIVNSFRSGIQRRIEATSNLDLVFGEASFSGSKSIIVRSKDGESTFSADRIFINAGTRASRPNVEGLEQITYLDNVSVMELGEVPNHLLVLGGGYIGLEFGQLFRRLGSKVSVIQSRKQLLAGEDPDVAEEVAKILRQDGVEIFLDTKAARVEKAGGVIALQVSNQSKPATLTGSHLLVAAGRVPNSDMLNLQAAGVETDNRGFIRVNDRLETTAKAIYALGDIKGGPAFTHISYDDFRILRANLLENKEASTKDRQVPYCLFIDPQLGRVGITESEARAQGREIRVAKLPMTSVARALEVDETRGFIKAVVDAKTNQILGAAVLGIEGGEIMSMLETAMMGKLPYTTLREATYAHPTLAESLNSLFMAMDTA